MSKIDLHQILEALETLAQVGSFLRHAYGMDKAAETIVKCVKVLNAAFVELVGKAKE